MQYDKNSVICSGEDYTVACVDLETKRCKHILRYAIDAQPEVSNNRLRGHTDTVYAIQTQDQLVFSGSGDGHVRIWDSRKSGSKCEHIIHLHKRVRALSLRGSVFASGGGRCSFR